MENKISENSRNFGKCRKRSILRALFIPTCVRSRPSIRVPHTTVSHTHCHTHILSHTHTQLARAQQHFENRENPKKKHEIIGTVSNINDNVFIFVRSRIAHCVRTRRTRAHTQRTHMFARAQNSRNREIRKNDVCLACLGVIRSNVSLFANSQRVKDRLYTPPRGNHG